MNKLLFLDDIRDPYDAQYKDFLPEGEWDIYWVKGYNEFVGWVTVNGLPDAISFDHDLLPSHYTPQHLWDDYEESKAWQTKNHKKHFGTGRDCARWFIDEYCFSETYQFGGLTIKNKRVLPELFVHSANPVGADWIREELNKHK